MQRASKIRNYFALFLCSLALVPLSSCQKYCDEFNPNLDYFPNPSVINSRPSAFEPLSAEERRQDWGKELRIAYAFINEQDYYRAITALKRALVLLPPKERSRKEQVHYAIFESYYLAYKYKEAIEAFEGTPLENVSRQFPAYQELLIALYDCYYKIGHFTRADKIHTLIENDFADQAQGLRLSEAVRKADFPALIHGASGTCYQEDVNAFLYEYHSTAKSPKRARTLQALLPGAGYYYVGLKNTAVTSFILNGLFIWAAGTFFNNGNTAAGLITLSLETGWYFGGINGAGLAAQEFNERLYEVKGQDFLRSRSLYPILMLGTSF